MSRCMWPSRDLPAHHAPRRIGVVAARHSGAVVRLRLAARVRITSKEDNPARSLAAASTTIHLCIA